MPRSSIPEPGENETECARCGAHFSIELTRCPSCGVNLYEPEDDGIEEGVLPPRSSQVPKKKLRRRLNDLFRRLMKKPDAVETLFGAALNQAELFNDLRGKVNGDRAAAERLVEYERGQFPQGNRTVWIQNAIRRWEKDQ